jgi:sensor histidine kinase YesM
MIFNFYLASRKYPRYWFTFLHIAASLLFGMLHKIMTQIAGLLLERLFLEQETKTWNELLALWPTTYWDALHGTAMYWIVLLILLALDYYRQFRDQYILLLELENRLARSRLQAMRMQLHPHFLFNALNTIAMMVRRNSNGEAVNMISGLSDMLRSALSKENKQFVTLEEELSLINKYLSIESVRYQDRLEVQQSIAAETLPLKVPNLVLQPIVENAFKHGVAKSLDKALVKISTSLNGNHLFIEIYNTSAGLPFNWNINRPHGIGLGNTVSRLVELYKGNFKFQIHEKEEGIAVQISLPIQR